MVMAARRPSVPCRSDFSPTLPPAATTAVGLKSDLQPPGHGKPRANTSAPCSPAADQYRRGLQAGNAPTPSPCRSDVSPTAAPAICQRIGLKPDLRSLFASIGLLLTLAPAHAAVSVNDDLGRQLALARPAQRIISLAPHLTEDLFAIGAGGQIVGVVDYSDYPAAAKQIPRVGGYSGFDLERIRTLKPDLIVGWPSGNPSRQLQQLEKLGIPLFYDNTRRLTQLPTVLQRLGILTGRPAEAGRAAQGFRDRLAALRQRYAGKPPVRVFYQVWDRPLMTINREQIISDAIELCAGVNVFGQLPALVPTVDEETVLQANPQLIVTSGEAGMASGSLERWRRWPALEANRRQALVNLPPDLLSRIGPRLIDGAERLCQAIDQARQSR